MTSGFHFLFCSYPISNTSCLLAYIDPLVNVQHIFLLPSLCILFFNFMLHSEKVKHMPKFNFSLSCLVVDLKNQNTTSSLPFQKMRSVLLLPNFLLSCIFCLWFLVTFFNADHFWACEVESLTQFL